MEFLKTVANWYAALPAAVMLFLGIFIVGMLLARLNAFKAFKAATYVAAGLVAITTLVSMFTEAVVPVLTTVVNTTGLKLNIIDLGIGSSANTVYALKFYVLLLPLGLLINVIMILLKLTKTFSVDFVNYGTMGLNSAFVMAITNSFPLAIGAFVITEVILLKLADITAPKIQEAYGLEGVSIPHASSVVFAPVGMFVNWAIEKIPGLSKIDWSLEKIESKFKGLVQPSTLGFVMSIVLGIVAKLAFGDCLLLGITVACFMILFPKALGILIEGITPVAEGMREYTEKKLNRKLYIGLDAAILIGMPDIMSVGILLIPVILLLAFILPGNHVLPLADLAIAAPFLVSCVLPFCKKNIFRGFIAGIIVFTIGLYMCTGTAEYYTAVAAMNGLPFDTTSTSVGLCSSPLGWIIAKVATLFVH